MKCITCGKPTVTPHDLLCSEHAVNFVMSVNNTLANHTGIPVKHTPLMHREEVDPEMAPNEDLPLPPPQAPNNTTPKVPVNVPLPPNPNKPVNNTPPKPRVPAPPHPSPTPMPSPTTAIPTTKAPRVTTPNPVAIPKPPMPHHTQIVAPHTVPVPPPRAFNTEATSTKPHHRLHINPLAIFSLLAFMATIIGLGYVFGVFPYKEAIPLVKATQTLIPENEKSYYDLLNQMQQLANFNLELDTEPDQVSSITRFATTLASRANLPLNQSVTDLESLARALYPSAGSVAGAALNRNPLAYDQAVEQDTQLVLATKGYLKSANTKHDTLYTALSQVQTMWVAQDLTEIASPMLAKSEQFLDEVDKILALEDYSLEIYKRFQDMGVALDQAFYSSDEALVLTTLQDIASEIVDFQTRFIQMDKPIGSEKVVENVNLSIQSTLTMVGEFEAAVRTYDYNRMVDAANLFLVESAKYTNRAADDAQTFWRTLSIGELFAEWQTLKRAVVNKAATIEASPFYQAAQAIPF